jgi:nucleosome binding factor SPN SPT16 subunit
VDKGESATSSLTIALNSALKKSGMEIGVDVSAGFSGVLAVKDNAARENIMKAAEHSTRVLKKFVVKEMEDIIDQEKKISHSDLADQAEDAIKDPTKVDPKTTLKADDLDSCYSPIIQSGSRDDKFDLRASASSSANPLAYDSGTTIIIQLGARYKNYCANVGRTYFVNPLDEQKEVYHVLTDVYMACKKIMRHGQKVSAVYHAAIKAIQDAKRPDLLKHFTKSCGFGMGLEFREAALVLNDKNSKVLSKGMVFNLCVGFQDLQTKPSAATGGVPRSYAVLIADTVCVTDKDDAEAWTRLPREFKDVSYHLGDDQEEQAEMDAATEEAVREAAAQERRTTRGVGKDAVRSVESKDEGEAKRAAHQKELMKKKIEEALKRYAQGGVDEMASTNTSFDLSTLHVYKAVSDYPKDMRGGKVYVDVPGDAVILPINDQMVPFHISTITRALKRDENGFTYLTIKFLVPDSAAARAKMKVRNIAAQCAESCVKRPCAFKAASRRAQA